MAFWNKHKLPPEFRDLTEDQIAERLQQGEVNAAQATAEKTRADAAAAALATRDTELTTTRAKVTELERASQAGRGGEGNGGGGGEGGGNQPAGSPELSDWLTNPNDAYNRMAAGTNAVALHGAIMAAQLTADNFITQQGPVNARLWKKYKGEVTANMSAMGPELRANPQAWINNFIFVKGMHAEDIVKEGQSMGDNFFSETASSTGAGLNLNSDEAAKKKNEPTEADRKQAAKYGIPIERYMKTRAGLSFESA